MAKFVKKFLDWVIERNIKTSEVGRVDGITLIDVRERGGCFKTTIENALHLIRQNDLRRYARVKRYISRIVNGITPSGVSGDYNFSTRTIHIEFREMSKFTDEERAAFYACILIHKATFAVLRQARRRVIDHPENQIRRARLYVAENNSFLEKLVEADLLPFPTFKLLQMELDEKRKPKVSKKSFLRVIFSAFWKAVTDRKIKTK
jgi:hypothetical protein